GPSRIADQLAALSFFRAAFLGSNSDWQTHARPASPCQQKGHSCPCRIGSLSARPSRSPRSRFFEKSFDQRGSRRVAGRVHGALPLAPPIRDSASRACGLCLRGSSAKARKETPL